MPDQFTWMRQRQHLPHGVRDLDGLLDDAKAMLHDGALSKFEVFGLTRAIDKFIARKRDPSATTAKAASTDRFSHPGTSTGDPLADELLWLLSDHEIIDAGGLSRTDISDFKSRNTPSAQITASLELLHRLGLVEMHKEGDGGRARGAPLRVWSVVPGSVQGTL